MSDNIRSTFDAVKAFCEKHNIPDHHGYGHYIAVLNHAKQAVKEFKLTKKQKLAVYLAALLHDVDDRKCFPDSKDYENARMLLQGYNIENTENAEIVDLAIKMIKLVSFSTNGNNVGDYPEWMLIPRYADRLEAIGKIGVRRCWEFTRDVGRPLYTVDTPRFTNIDEMITATQPRLANYVAKAGKVGESSFIDHFYDKLIHLGITTGISYINDVCQGRMQQMYDVALLFGNQGYITDAQILAASSPRSFAAESNACSTCGLASGICSAHSLV